MAATANRTRPRVKYCGITRLEDALIAVELGVDALGFVFYENSPRAIPVTEAARIIASLPAFVTTVGLFVDADPSTVEATIERTRIDLVQYHGGEDAQQCGLASRPYIKALKMRDGNSFREALDRYPDARGILVDAYVPGLAGGTGQTFDWAELPADIARPMIVAGGLTVDNVGAAIGRFGPYAVDVSSGIETAPGLKDETKMRQFMAEVEKTIWRA